MEISKMLTISCCHVSLETYHSLIHGIDIDVLAFTATNCDYPSEFGAIINCCCVEDFDGENTDIPYDLMMCMDYAYKHGCSWLRRCEDGERVRGLRWYYDNN